MPYGNEALARFPRNPVHQFFFSIADPTMLTLSLGSSGNDVSALQEKLRTLGLLNSPPSGIFHAETKRATELFQKRHPWLTADGVVGIKTAAEINDSISRLEGEIALQRCSSGQASLNMPALKANSLLSLAIQRRLNRLGLYPGGKLLDGDFGTRSQSALQAFCRQVGLVPSLPFQLTPEIATALINTKKLDSILEQAHDPSHTLALYRDFEQAVGANADKLAFLDMGAEQSPFKDFLYCAQELLRATTSNDVQSASPEKLTFSEYPSIGCLPKITPVSPSILGSGITEACLCIGKISQGRLAVSWLGKDALDLVECWSASKIIPILNIYSQLADRIPVNPDDLMLKNIGTPITQLQLASACIDICSYRRGVSMSNALAATFNSFERQRVEWIKSRTGNTAEISFGGRYKDDQTILLPEIRDIANNRQLMHSQLEASGGNSISVYDLTRFISLVGWHELLSETQRLPAITERGCGMAMMAFSTDTARYIETALTTLGLTNSVDSLVILSKLGFGESERRGVTEIVYTAFVQFIDRHQPSVPALRSFALTLRSSKPGSGSQACIQVDTAIAVAVTEIIRRIITDDFS